MAVLLQHFFSNLEMKVLLQIFSCVETPSQEKSKVLRHERKLNTKFTKQMAFFPQN